MQDTQHMRLVGLPPITQEDMQVTLSYTRSQGIRAIMDLQLMAGVLEGEVMAANRWDGMPPATQALTEVYHRKFFKEPSVAPLTRMSCVVTGDFREE